MWSVCPEARHNLCVWRQTSISRAVILLWKSSWRLMHTQTLTHVFTHTHTAHIRGFPLTETDASQLTLKCVLSKSSEMPSSTHASPSQAAGTPKRWHPHLQHTYHSDWSLEGKLMLFTMTDCLNWLKQETCRHKYNIDLSNWVIW